MPVLWWFVCVLLWPVMPCEPAEEIAARQGADCAYGCIVVAGGMVYELSWSDVEYIALLAKAESGPRFVRDESSATVWAMVQRFVEINMARPAAKRLTLAQSIRSYSAVLGSRWRTGGPKGYHPRITPRADAYTGVGWNDLPPIWRLFTEEFLDGQVDNEWPGVVHVLARGFEDAAADHLIGPFYASTAEEHPGGNCYFKTAETEFWAPWTVRIVPARREIR